MPTPDVLPRRPTSRRPGPRLRRRSLPPLLLAALAGGRAGTGGPLPAAAVVPGKNGRIAVTIIDRDDPQAEAHIHTMSAKGKKAKQVTDGVNDHDPRWSPDGATILFSRGDDIWVVAATGGTPTNLTNSAEVESGAAWSPDGTTIAYTRGDEIWTMQANGAGQALLVAPGTGATRGIDWSPDGTTIAFGAPGAQNPSVQVWVVDSDGQNPTPLTDAAGDARTPRWSPDGSRIVFVLGGDIWTMQPDGSNQEVLAAGSAEQTYYRLACSPDGKRVLAAVIDNTTDIWSLQTVPSAGGAPKVVKGTYSNKVRYLISDPDWQTKPRKGSQRASAKPDRGHDRIKHEGRRKPGR